MMLAMGHYDVAHVLREFEKQTGNRIGDRRSKTSPAKVEIGFSGQSFWPALEQLAEKLDARITYYGDEGIALADGPHKKGAVAFADICRLEIKNLAVQRDVEADRRTCVLDLDVVWAPRFEPFYLTVDRVKGRFATDAHGKELSIEPICGVAQAVAQRRAQTVELRMPGPERSSPSLAALSGEVKFLGPTRMVTARFDKLKPGSEAQSFTEEGVTVTLKKIVTSKSLWSFTLEIANPEGTPEFESFQSWIDNNRIHLERLGGKDIWSPPANEREVALLTSRHAKITYHFTGAQAKGNVSQWALVYRTPGRIVEFSVPFEFRNVALP